MTITELTVVVVCLVVGYWLVSRLLPGGATKKTKASSEDPPRQRSEQKADRDDEPPRPRYSEHEPQWWDVLGVPSTASVAEIKRAYQSLVRQYHPDKVATLGVEIRELSERKTKELNVAFEQAMRQKAQ